ncbi:hypothetical protein HPB51_028359 [Rhipicephalus microplus]|uniref:Uncharacterized protein n=1 Tax=Rhipicephalus microplus TaxID=6941 RepID=A0A9J6CY19_RHIMP|nr:hypothetical protein HPB51_028359 [Rhipicephalus microplus]
MFPAISPPPFLQCPGVPLIPWKTWRRVVQVYVNAAASDATPGAKMALLLNRLGGEGLQAADEQMLPKGVIRSDGGRFHCKAALEHATEEESVDRALQQLAALQADSITRREHQRRDIRLP